MTLPAPSSAPPPRYAQHKRGNGCLWGCLILMLIFLLPPVLLGGYGAWFLYDGFRHSPARRAVARDQEKWIPGFRPISRQPEKHLAEP